MTGTLQAIANLSLVLIGIALHVIWVKSLVNYDPKEHEGEEIEWP